MIVRREVCGSVLAVVTVLFLLSCSSERSSPVTISPPDSLRQIQAVDGSQIYAEITVNDDAAQTFTFSSTSPTEITLSGVVVGQNNQITINWFETFEGSVLQLAAQQGEFFADPQALTTISLDYNYQFDADGDSIVNLQERVDNTCPIDSCATASSGFIPPVLKAIPAGEFIMGSDDPEDPEDEAPAHTVFVDAFKLAESEVTWDQWSACVDDGGCDNPRDEAVWLADLENRGQHPVSWVSWGQIQEFIVWINLTIPGVNYRLPTEAEFEYALRAGVTSRYAYGDDGAAFCDFVNGANSSGSCTDGYQFSAPVKTFSPNVYGLYDMNGNVGEWVQDCVHRSYVGAPATSEAWLGTEEECNAGVIRGGNWKFLPVDFRITERRVGKPRHPDFPEEQEGFRLAAD